MAILNRLTDLGVIQFTNETTNQNVGYIYVDTDLGIELITNQFGQTIADTNTCAILTGGLPSDGGGGSSGSSSVSAILEIQSKTGALLVSRMNAGDIAALTAPANGMIIYNTDTNKFNVYRNGGWAIVSNINSPSATATNTLVTWGDGNGEVLNNTNISIDPSNGGMSFPEGAVLDLSASGRVKATNIDAYMINCEALSVEEAISITELTSTTINTNTIKCDTSVTTNLLHLMSMTIAERDALQNVSNGTMLFTTDNGGAFNFYINGIWHISVTTPSM